jgi:hypothetical protein
VLYLSIYRADNLTTSTCTVLTNNGNLNLQKPRGPVQACKGVAMLYIQLEKSVRLSGTPPAMEFLKEMDCVVANSIENSEL